MGVPWLTGPMPELDISNTALKQSPGEHRLPSVDTRAVHLLDIFWFVSGIEDRGRLGLHPKGKLERFNPSFKPWITTRLPMLGIVRLQQFELPLLCGERGVRTANVLNQFIGSFVRGIDISALHATGQEPCLPVRNAAYWISVWAHGNKAGEILVFRS